MNFWISLLFRLCPLLGFAGSAEGAVDRQKHLLLTLDRQKSPSVQAFQTHLKEEGISYEILQDLSTLAPDIFYGLSIAIDDPEDLSKLEKSAHVQSVSPVRMLEAAEPVDRKVLTAPLPSPLSDYPPHIQTNVTQLHRLGIFGEGIKIAVLDSAVDCSHPALGGGYGRGFKIGFGRDLVGDGYDGQNTPKPGGSPCGNCADLATHTCGIIGASDVGQGFTGVAPNATLGVYRVFGCSGPSGDNVIVEALLSAHKDGADVISVSIGYPGGWAQGGPLLETVNKLVEKGATIIFSAGNHGKEGLFFTEEAASAAGAISTGSVDSIGVSAARLVTSTGRELYYYAASTLAEFNQSYPIYATANSTLVDGDACDPLPPSTPNLKNYVVLIRRGKCWISIKVQNALAKGANKILVYMNSAEQYNLGEDVFQVRMAGISQSDGEFLHEQSQKDPNGFTVKFPPMPLSFAVGEGGTVSEWSSYGPGLDFISPQPALCAVGGNIVSTSPVVNGSYALMSGTSMAAPQLAAIAGLVMSVRGKEVRGLAMRARLSSTAHPLLDPSDNHTYHTVAHQGGGVVNAYCAVFANTSVSTSALSLNDTSNSNATQTFHITNGGASTIRYTVSHVPAATVYTFSSESQYSRPDQTPVQDKMAANVKLSTESFSLGPGASQAIKAIFEPPAIDPNLLPVYSGFIALTTDQLCESHTVAYYGVVGSLKDQKILDQGPTTDNYTYTLPYIGFKTQKETEASTFRNGDLIWNRHEHNSTFISFRTNFATPSLRLYLVQDPNSTSPNSNLTTAGQQLPIPKDCAIIGQRFPLKSCKGHVFLGEIMQGDLLDIFNDDNGSRISRSSASETWVTTWNGTMKTEADGPPQRVPEGRYQVNIRALRMAGDPMEEEMYENWLSPFIVIQN